MPSYDVPFDVREKEKEKKKKKEIVLLHRKMAKLKLS